MSELIDITPRTSLINSFRAQNGKWSVLIAEAIDNSLDADANEIEIDMENDEVTIMDNGVGVTRDRWGDLFRLGGHGHMESTQLGRFGVGLKANACSAGDVMQVDTCSEYGRLVGGIDWRELSINPTGWKMLAPSRLPRGNSAIGTRIRISELRWKRTLKDAADTASTVSFLFYPAIERGKIIKIDGVKVPLLERPALREPKIEATLEFGGGRSAYVQGGMLSDPHKPKTLKAVHVSYKHRVIISNNNIGCGESCGYTMAFIEVRLAGEWELTQFKNDIVDKQKDELDQKLQVLIKKILKECEDEEMSLKLRDIENKLNEMLQSNLRSARPTKKNPQGRSGKKKGKQGGMTKDSDPDGGPARAPVSRGLKIRIVPNLAEEYGVGKFQSGNPKTIDLAKDCPRIAELTESKTKDSAIKSLYDIAIAIYLVEKERKPDWARVMYTPGYEPFGLQYWNSIKQQRGE